VRGKAPRKSPAKTRSGAGEDADVVAGIKLSNPAKVLYPEAGYSKRDLALYYEAIGSVMLPHVKDRPLTLVRCPNGWDKQCFYQKHADVGVPEVIGRVEIEDSSGPSTYMTVDSVSGIVAMLQLGALEIHPWGSRANKLDRPDRIIFDFDPDDGLAWAELVQAVQLLRTLLDELGLQSFLKTTGGKGLHVVIPIEPTVQWSAIKGFTKAVAELLMRTFPDRFTSNIAKAKRGGKIFVDYLRNGEGATAIAPYSIRARANAPVATPIEWEELRREVRYDHFNIRTVQTRLRRLKRDPWADFDSIRQSVTKTMMKQVGYSATAK
jgi:bifunctional non-homologous end joining protein LigD